MHTRLPLPRNPASVPVDGIIGDAIYLVNHYMWGNYSTLLKVFFTFNLSRRGEEHHAERKTPGPSTEEHLFLIIGRDVITGKDFLGGHLFFKGFLSRLMGEFSGTPD
jgi:hypothetical protein